MSSNHRPYGRPPLDYTFALDAATTLLPAASTPRVICNLPELEAEVVQRFGDRPGERWTSALWVEPLDRTWRADLGALAGCLAPGSTLAVVASRPLARALPERHSWSAAALGMRLSGLRRLCRLLRTAGFEITAGYGIHTLAAIGLGRLSALAEAAGRADVGDRLGFAARLRYHTAGPAQAFATVALLAATRGRAR